MVDPIIRKAETLQKKAYALLADQGQYVSDLPNKFPFGIFMQIARKGVDIEDVSTEGVGLEIMDPEGNVYAASLSEVKEIKEPRA